MSSTEIQAEIIQYVPFMSFVHPSFWHTLTELKLDVDRLSESTKQIHGRFTNRDDIGTVFEVDGTSFNKTPESDNMYINVIGNLINKNTIEDFKCLDKAALLNSVGEIMWSNIKRQVWISSPSALLNFVILSFADLKKFHYYYWFAFPSPSQPTVLLKESTTLVTHFNNKQIEDLRSAYKSLEENQRPFFVVVKEDENVFVKRLSEVLKRDENELNLDCNYLAFSDASSSANPGWTLRLFLAALLDLYPSLPGSELKVIGLRCGMSGGINNSRIYIIKVPENVQSAQSAGWVGWERNDKGNFGPKLANMAASMDPVRLADASSDLNIKLMKWRLVPNIDVDIMKTTKCLLLGAGTLGCHVARDLLVINGIKRKPCMAALQMLEEKFT